MTVYTTLPTDDLNLAVEVTESNDMVTLNITPASVNVTSAVTSVNGLTGNVTLTTTEISEGTNLYYTDARAQTVITANTEGFIKADSTDTLTNKSGSNLQWTNDAGYITEAGDNQTLAFSTPNLSITGGNSVDLTSLTTGLITASSTDTLTNKSGNISMFTNDANYSTTTGTVTPTSTDTFTNKSGNISMWTNDSAYLTSSALTPYYTSTQVNALPVSTFTNDANYSTTTGTVTPTSTDTFTNKSGNISQWTNDSGYLTSETDSQTLAFADPILTISGSLSTADLSALKTTTLAWSTITGTPTTIAGYGITDAVTSDSTTTFTNKSGAISQWTNDSAYLTSSALTPYYTSTQVDALPVSTFTNDAGYLTAETDSQTLAFSTPNLTISNGNTVDLTTLTTDFITASSTDTLTNKSGNISQWTNDSAYLVASALTPYYTSTQVDALPVSTFSNDAGYSTTTGTVTPSSTDTFTNKSGAISQWTNDANYSTTTGTVTPSSTDTFTNKSGNISQWTNDSGYLTAETDSQTLSFTSPNLTISNGNTVDIGSLEVATIDGGTY